MWNSQISRLVLSLWIRLLFYIDNHWWNVTRFGLKIFLIPVWISFLDEPIVKWIDFGKTAKTELPLKHDIPWESGSSEEGLLIGLTNLIDTFSSLASLTSTSQPPATSNESEKAIFEKPVTSSDTSIVKMNRTQKKNFFIDLFKICSRTMSKPKIWWKFCSFQPQNIFQILNLYHLQAWCA